MPDNVTVEVPVKVKNVTVSSIKNVDAKYKASAPKQIKPQIEKGLAKIKLQIPKDKELGALAVDVAVAITRTDKGVNVKVSMVPSEDNKMLGGASGEATVPLDKGADPDDGDVKAAAEAAADTAIDSVKKVFAAKLKD
jgi:hypothetical protein